MAFLMKESGKAGDKADWLIVMNLLFLSWICLLSWTFVIEFDLWPQTIIFEL